MYTITLQQNSHYSVPDKDMAATKKITKLTSWLLVFFGLPVFALTFAIIRLYFNQNYFQSTLDLKLTLIGQIQRIGTSSAFNFAPPILHMSFSASYFKKVKKFLKKLRRAVSIVFNVNDENQG